MYEFDWHRHAVLILILSYSMWLRSVPDHRFVELHPPSSLMSYCSTLLVNGMIREHEEVARILLEHGADGSAENEMD